MHNFYRGKSSPKIGLLLYCLKKPTVNNRQIGKKSPNLVTLLEGGMDRCGFFCFIPILAAGIRLAGNQN
jgi:hypothetical protein